MKYIKSKKYQTPELMSKIMGPNPVKLCEELLLNHKIPENAVVCDLGSGQGLTSVFMAKEYGFKVYACDLWSEPEENLKFFKEMGVEDKVIPIKADATDLKFDKEFFDGIVSTDSYNYFGRNKEYLDKCLLPFVKTSGYIYITIPGMKKDCHNNLPKELLLSWNEEQLDYIHDINYWKNIIEASSAQVIDVYELEGNEEVWSDWLKQDNEYAVGDRKTMEAGGGKYLNFIGIVLRKKG